MYILHDERIVDTNGYMVHTPLERHSQGQGICHVGVVMLLKDENDCRFHQSSRCRQFRHSKGLHDKPPDRMACSFEALQMIVVKFAQFLDAKRANGVQCAKKQLSGSTNAKGYKHKTSERTERACE
jgi:hypothetical protein